MKIKVKATDIDVVIDIPVVPRIGESLYVSNGFLEITDIVYADPSSRWYGAKRFEITLYGKKRSFT